MLVINPGTYTAMKAKSDAKKQQTDIKTLFIKKNKLITEMHSLCMQANNLLTEMNLYHYFHPFTTNLPRTIPVNDDMKV